MNLNFKSFILLFLTFSLFLDPFALLSAQEESLIPLSIQGDEPGPLPPVPSGEEPAPPAPTSPEKKAPKKKKKKEDTRIEIKLKPFFTANKFLKISRININSTRGYGEFKMTNNTRKDLTLIFARVYRYEEKEGKKLNYTLINNPNKPGILLSGIRHQSGKDATWRFRLFGSSILEGPQYKYTINVNQRSLFFE